MTTAAVAAAEQISCPTWCEESHDPQPMHPGDVLHMASVDGGVAVPRFSGKGWLELYFSLVSERRGDGSFTPPFIEASMEAPETIGRMYTQDAAEKVIAGLEAAADGLRTYLGSLPATADWVDEHLKRS